MAVDINNATAEDLAEAVGIGHELAESIIDYRDTVGGITSLDEIAEIPGCDEQLVMRLREAGVNLGSSIEVDGNSSL